jgi:hypothetical protein
MIVVKIPDRYEAAGRRLANAIKKMKLIRIFFFLSLLGCSSNENKINVNKIIVSHPVHSNRYTPLLGKWIKVLKAGVRTIEIKDSTTVLVYTISNNNETSDTLRGTLTIMPRSYISIDFPTWRFYYRWVKDTLIQEDEQGEQERYIKRNL